MGREAESLEKQNSVWIRKTVRGGNLAQAHRHDASGINFVVGHVVVPFEVIEIHGVGIGRDLGIPNKLAYSATLRYYIEMS